MNENNNLTIVRNIAKIESVGISTVMRLKKEFCN